MSSGGVVISMLSSLSNVLPRSILFQIATVDFKQIFISKFRSNDHVTKTAWLEKSAKKDVKGILTIEASYKAPLVVETSRLSLDSPNFEN